ncbi:MAG TPA: hypothetical protein VE093_41575 [Polyangiaceae bacterium]|jgi:hypothetical protein|nr:hypothetical protein [Polyangiaceae bacterium]
MRPRLISSAIAALSLLGCSSSYSEADNPACGAGLVLAGGACVEPARRYEPAERADENNVVAFGEPLQTLDLPEPPKRGFRLIAAPRTVAPGEEIETCISWPFPEALSSNIVHAGRLYTTPGLHHSNVVTKPADPADGPQPYPKCHPGAYDPFGALPEVIPDVLFANSTQVTGKETLLLPEGIGFKVDTSRDIVTSIHFLNTSSEPLRVEVAYDFFTMPEEELQSEAAPFVLQVNDFLIPPHTTGSVGSTCTVFGGKVAAMMPHTHKLLESFTVDMLHEDGAIEPVYAKGAYDTESDIKLFDPPLEISSFDQMRFECVFNNTTDHDVVYGLGENEMCILFGYVYPAQKQFVGYSDVQGDPCTSFQIGLFR